MVGRGELTEAAWEQLAALLPSNGRRGGQWQDHRTVINGIRWQRRTGAPWRALPERYGSWQTCHTRFGRWQRDGTWDRLLAHVQTKADAVGEVRWEVSIDSTVVRAQQHASGARRRPSQAAAQRGASIQVMTGVDAAEAGYRRSCTWRVPGRAAPCRWCSRLASDMRARSWKRCWMACECRRWAVDGRDGVRPGCSLRRGTAFRAVGERCGGVASGPPSRRARTSADGASMLTPIGGATSSIGVNRLTQFRGIVTRYEKRVATFRAMMVIASLVIWLGS